MLWLGLILCIVGNGSGAYFDSYSRKQLSDSEVQNYRKKGIIFQCTNRVRLPCQDDDFRRVDGSCNNLKNVSYGTTLTPYLRLLPPVFGPGLSDRESEKGGKLPLVRVLRDKILDVGSVPNKDLTILAMYFLRFTFLDSGNMQDTYNYLIKTTNCCTAEGKEDYNCAPNEIPTSNPFKRFPDVRCTNQTRPITFQTHGCVANGTTTPARTNLATPLLDLSNVYHFEGKSPGRLFEGGKLYLDEINDKLWPRNGGDLCTANQQPEENLCFKRASNIILGGRFMSVMMFRLHNYIAQQLENVNPCWDDEMLFFTARDITISVYTQILMYELLPLILGRENMIRKGIILRFKGFRKTYNQNITPQVSEEYIYALRYFHTVQETKLIFNNSSDGTKTFNITDSTLRTGYFLPGNHFAEITKSSFTQACGAFDHTVDPSIAEVGLGSLQKATDVTMNDLAKGRTIGFPGYIKYREFCGGENYEDFDDLSDVMDQDRIDIIRSLYATVGDIDLMVGMWSERPMPASRVPYTVFCLLADQLERFIDSDRYWYELSDKPHALSRPQLNEIRNATIAAILCLVGDGVTEIQKNAFMQITNENPLESCSNIQFLNFKAWQTNETC